MTGILPCPTCGSTRSTVGDSRGSRQGVRRRRECHDCSNRWTTIEMSVNALQSRSLLRKAVLLQKMAALFVDELKRVGSPPDTPGPPRKEKVKP